MEMRVLENTGAYGTHALTVMSVTGNRALSLYRCPNLRYEARAVYTNLAVAGAFRGYGCPQGFFALESHVDEIAQALGEDPLELRRRNHVQEGDEQPIAEVLGEGKEGHRQVIRSCGLPQAIQAGAKAIGWTRRRKKLRPANGTVRRGIGMAIVMQASGIPGVDMGAASIKMNEDGSFNLLVGATDIGTGADTMFCQIAAEALGVPMEKIIPYSSDTDMTPFDPGAYASSTTYISGRAVEKAARLVLQQITEVGGRMLEEKPDDLVLHAGKVCAKDGRFVTYEQVCLSSLYQKDQFQIMATASHMSYDSPPPFAAVFAEVEVDMETGLVRGAEAGGGRGLRPGGEPADGGGPGGGRGHAVDGLRALRAHAVRRERADAVPLVPRLHDRGRHRRAGDRHHPRADPRADRPLRGQGHRGDPDQRPRARHRQRGGPGHGRAHPGDPAHPRAGAGRPAWGGQRLKPISDRAGSERPGPRPAPVTDMRTSWARRLTTVPPAADGAAFTVNRKLNSES
jgi:hypothetical protein